MKVDLHIHSKWSDGSISTAEIISLAKSLGIDAVSITDHDTMAGQNEAVEEGKRQGVIVIPGVEISAYNAETGRKAHILGFNVKDIEGLNKVCKPYLEARYAKNLESVDIIEKAGYPVNREIVQKYAALDGVVYRQHIMHALADFCYTPAIYGELYTKLFGKEGLAVTKATYISAQEAVKAIIDCGGSAVLAHPFQYDTMDYLPQLVHWGIKGVECHHHTQTTERQEAVKKAAEKYNLFLTGGSDFHGFYSEKTMPLGSNNTDMEKGHELLQYFNL